MRTPCLSPPRRVASWIAILALVWGALAPLVSHALARGNDIGWEAICSTSSPASPLPDTDHALDHCPCCSAHEITLAPPPAPWVASPRLVLLQRVLPQRFLDAARTASAWSSAQPRAPPLFA